MKSNSLLPLHYPPGYHLSHTDFSATGQNGAPLDDRDSSPKVDCKDIASGPSPLDNLNKPVVGLRKARLAIQGMTCTGCTSTISSTVESLPGVESVDVHFTSNQAIIIYRPDDIKPDEVVNKIGDCGYGAILGEDEDLEPLACIRPPDTRSINVEIRGYDRNSLSVVNERLGQLGLSSFTPITMDQPISRIEYRPSRDLTIRRISDFHGGITASVHHRPSMHKLMQEGQRREANMLSYLLLLSFSITFPTFFIGVVGMTLLPHSNIFHIWCETIIWGGCQRSVVSLFVLGTVSQFAVNQYFIVRAWKSLTASSGAWQWSRLIHFGSMDLLVALSTTTAYLSSLGLFIRDILRPMQETMEYGTTSYFDSSVFLGFAILIGRVLEHYTRLKTNDAIALLEGAAPDDALLLADIEKPDAASKHGEYLLNAPVTEIPADHIEVGDFLLLPVGTIPSADGIIVAGSSSFDESSLTGESLPVPRATGDTVMTGTTNLTAPVVFRVEKVGQETMMQKIIRAVAEGQSKKSPIQVLADRIASVFVPLVIYASFVVLVVWLVVLLTIPDSSPILPGGKSALGDRIAAAFQFAIAALVIACPCGVGLAGPTAHAVGSGLLAKAGILAQGGGEAFQLASDVDVIVFDKTGTLTMGKTTVAQSFLADEGDAWLWEAVAGAEATSTHPLAQGILSFCRDRSPSSPSPLLQPVTCEETAGRGMGATYLFKGEEVRLSIGNDVFISEEDKDFAVPDSLKDMADMWRNQGSTVIFVLRRDSNGSSVPLMLGLVDQVRPGFETTISTLKAAGKDIYMLTGDNEQTARAVARRVGIDEHHVKASAMPLEKAQFIRDLKTRKRITRSTMLGCRRRTERDSIVTFVGDGLNDSVALAAADFGIALSHGSQVSIASASFIILSDRSASQAVTQLFRISSKVYRRQIINFGWAMLYNVALIPVAAGVLYPYRQTRLSPVWSSIAMSLSSVSVVVSSLALKWGF